MPPAAAVAAPAAAGAAGAGAGLAGAAGASGLAGMIGSAMPYIQATQGVMNMVGPQGSLVKGDILGTAQNAQSMLGAFSKPAPMSEPTTMNQFGLSAGEFTSLDPQIQQALLRKAMGR